MIICLYHGSSFKNINEEQTRPVTNIIKEIFNDEVYEAYYSEHVCKTLKRRENIDMSLNALLEEVYNKYNEINILATNVIPGEEYNLIIKKIKEFDVQNKIKITQPLLNKNTVWEVAEAILNKEHPIIYVGHGSNITAQEYKDLNNILKENNNYAMTLKDDLEQFLKENKVTQEFTFSPLMFTAGYHVKIDIENRLVTQAQDLEFKPQINTSGLCQNKEIINMLINNLKTMI